MLRRSLFISLAVVLFSLAAWQVLITYHRSQRPDVILITVESLRNDMVSRETLPRLLDIGNRGFRFRRHRAVSGWTGSNIVTLLTGLNPFESGVHTRGQTVDADRKMPLETLADKGYRVEGIQGFMTMDIFQHLGLGVVTDTPELLYHLALKKEDDRPFFTWYHYLHTHLPYTVAGGKTGAQPEQLSPGVQERLARVQEQATIHYDATTFQPGDIPLVHDLQQHALQEFDEWFARFWDFFTRSGLRRNTILIVTADHGDEHGERGMVGHASTTLLGHLHEEIVSVPLFIWLPPGIGGKELAAAPGQTSTHEDIMPTIFGLLGIEPALPFRGRNLFAGGGPSPWFGITSSGGFAEPDPENIRYFELGLMSGPWKLLARVDSSMEETLSLYNLEDDPAEEVNRAEAEPQRAAELQAMLRARFPRAELFAKRQEVPVETAKRTATRPVWLYPPARGIYRYDDMQGMFKLQWSGPEDRTYIIEYIAGEEDNRIHGFLDVDGPGRDFGNISRRYWNTWVTRYSPYRLRVREEGAEQWSAWLDIKAEP
jgi:arylsulfatase A-like enzyme